MSAIHAPLGRQSGAQSARFSHVRRQATSTASTQWQKRLCGRHVARWKPWWCCLCWLRARRCWLPSAATKAWTRRSNQCSARPRVLVQLGAAFDADARMRRVVAVHCGPWLHAGIVHWAINMVGILYVTSSREALRPYDHGRALPWLGLVRHGGVVVFHPDVRSVGSSASPFDRSGRSGRT